MSINFNKNLWIRIVQLEGGPSPLPLEHGFSVSKEYRILGMYNPSESGECWLILANDNDELWFISNRHVRLERVEDEV